MVAGVQFRFGQDTGQNLVRARRLIEQAAKNGAQLICLPELFPTWFFPAQPKGGTPQVETLEGPTVAWGRGLARELGISVVLPLAEQDPSERDHRYNSALAIDPAGKTVGRYRKLHVPATAWNPERDYFRPGREPVAAIQVGSLSVGVIICYDRHFPELVRVLALQGAQLVVVPSSVPRREGRSTAWQAELVALAVMNSIYVLGVNRCGAEGDVVYCGGSTLVDPSGTVIATAGEEEAVVSGAVSGIRVQEAREQFGHLSSVRADLCRQLADVVAARDPLASRRS